MSGDIHVVPAQPEQPQGPQQLIGKLSTEDADTLHAMLRSFREAQAAQEFITRHKDDYVPCEESSRLMQEYLDTHRLPITPMNLELAFQALTHGDGSTPAPAASPTPAPKSVRTGLPADTPGGINVDGTDEFDPATVARRLQTMDHDSARLFMSQLLAKARLREQEAQRRF